MDGGFENIPIDWVAVQELSYHNGYGNEYGLPNIGTEIEFRNRNPVKLKMDKARRLTLAFAKRVLRAPCCDEA